MAVDGRRAGLVTSRVMGKVIAFAFVLLLARSASGHDLTTPTGTAVQHVHERPPLTEGHKRFIEADAATFTARFAHDIQVTSPADNGQNCHGLTFDPSG